VAENKKEYPS